MVLAEHALVQNDALRLQLDGLEEVAELELDACELADARRDVLVHGPGDLQQRVDALTVKLEGPLEGPVLVGLLCGRQQLPHIVVLELQVLDDREQLGEVVG